MEASGQQPVSIAIEAGQSSLQMFKSGVLTKSRGQVLITVSLLTVTAATMAPISGRLSVRGAAPGVSRVTSDSCEDWVVRDSAVCLLDHHLIPAWTDLLQAQHRQHSMFLLRFLRLVLGLRQESRGVNLQHFGLDS